MKLPFRSDGCTYHAARTLSSRYHYSCGGSRAQKSRENRERLDFVLTEAHRKKNVKARREILLRAWPSMSATHRPDFVNLRAVKKQAPRSRTCMAEAYLWPYINLEDLQQRNFLLVFLNSRGRNLPDTFRLADVKAAHLGDGWEKVS